MSKIFFKRFLFISLAFLLLFPLISAGGKEGGSTYTPYIQERLLGAYNLGWRTVPGVIRILFLDLDETVCFAIETNGEYFIPTKTEGEWNSFRESASILGIKIYTCEKKNSRNKSCSSRERGDY